MKQINLNRFLQLSVLILVAFGITDLFTSGGSHSVIAFALAIGGATFSGKIGDKVYNRNGTVRHFAAPVQPNTDAQVNHRASWGAISSFWNTLTELQRSSWNALGASITWFNRIGTAYNPKGKAVMQQFNQNLSSVGVASINLPPALAPILEAPQVDLVGSDIAAGALNLQWDFAVPADHAMRVYMTGRARAGVTFDKGFRLIAFVGEGDGNTPIDLLAEYTSKFGVLVTGSRVKISCDLVNTTTGQASPPNQVTVVVG